MTAKAHEISLEAGSKMAAAMKDVINAAAGITGFVLESARDLVQYMVRRGQMTQEEADKLIRQAEEAQANRGDGAAPVSNVSDYEAADAELESENADESEDTDSEAETAEASKEIRTKPPAKIASKHSSEVKGAKTVAPAGPAARSGSAKTAAKQEKPGAKKSAAPAAKKGTAKRK